MFASASRVCPTCSRQQSQRTTRRTPVDGSSIGFQPVSSHSGQDIELILSVEGRAESCRAAQLVFRARFDLAHALARQVQAIADLLQRARLVVLETEPEPDDLALLAVEIAKRFGELVEVGLMNHLVFDRGHPVLLDEIAELARRPVVAGRAAADRLAERHVGGSACAPERREKLW